MPGFSELAGAAAEAAARLVELRNRSEELAQKHQDLSREEQELARDQRRRRTDAIRGVQRALTGGPAQLIGQAARQTIATRGAVDFQTGVTAGVAGAVSSFTGIGAGGISTNERTFQRVAAITENIARFGGEVSPELRTSLTQTFREQEDRVQRERDTIQGELARQNVESFANSDALKFLESVDANMKEAVRVIRGAVGG